MSTRGSDRTALLWRSGSASALVAAVLLAGCGDDSTDPPGEVESLGGEATVGSLRVADAFVLPPGGGDGYQVGNQVIAVFRMSTAADAPLHLTGASSRAAERVDLRWDPECDGLSDLVDSIPVPAVGDTSGAYYLMLNDLVRPVGDRDSVSIELRFSASTTTTVTFPVAATVLPYERWACLGSTSGEER